VALLERPVLADDRLSLISNIGFRIACAALAPDLLYDVERSAQSMAPLLDFAKRVSVSAARDLDSHLPNRWAARLVVHAGAERCEETLVRRRSITTAPTSPGCCRKSGSACCLIRNSGKSLTKGSPPGPSLARNRALCQHGRKAA
jgi:hypothetical protein